MSVARYWCQRDGWQVTAIVATGDVARCPVCLDALERETADGPPAPGAGGPLDGGAAWEDPLDGLLNGIRFVLAPDDDRVVHWQAYVLDPSPQPAPAPWTPVTGLLDPVAACGAPGPFRRPHSGLTPPCAGCRQHVAGAIRSCRARLLGLPGGPL